MSGGRAGKAAIAALCVWTFAVDASANSPDIDYMLQCRSCHLADGAGAPGRVPDLRDQIGLFLTVQGGREFLIRVPGSSQSPLDDARLAAVLNWMVREFGPASVAASFEPFDSEEVARHRSEPLIDVEGKRAGLLRQIAD